MNNHINIVANMLPFSIMPRFTQYGQYLAVVLGLRY